MTVYVPERARGYSSVAAQPKVKVAEQERSRTPCQPKVKGLKLSVESSVRAWTGRLKKPESDVQRPW